MSGASAYVCPLCGWSSPSKRADHAERQVMNHRGYHLIAGENPDKPKDDEGMTFAEAVEEVLSGEAQIAQWTDGDDHDPTVQIRRKTGGGIDRDMQQVEIVWFSIGRAQPLSDREVGSLLAKAAGASDWYETEDL